MHLNYNYVTAYGLAANTTSTYCCNKQRVKDHTSAHTNIKYPACDDNTSVAANSCRLYNAYW